MTREISYLVRHVVTLPDDFPASDESTNTTVEYVTNEALYRELTGVGTIGGAIIGRENIAVTTTSERLDK